MKNIAKSLSDYSIVQKYSERFERMKQTEQDQIHHQEGNVYVHTEMVLNALLALPEFLELNENEKEILIFTTLFHDICKPETAVEYDSGRISHPKHARKGANLTRQILDKENYDFDFISQVYYMVLFHGYPFHLFDKQNPLKDAIKMSVLSNNKWLYIFAKADLYGRICGDHTEMEYKLELYKEFCLENNIFLKPKSFESDYDRFHYFNLDDSFPDTKLYNDHLFEIYMLCGLPASGKDTYLKNNLLNLPEISMDKIREELKIKPNENQGIVIQESRERSKVFCRKKQSFIWNATNVTAQIRATLIGVWLPYKPKINIIFQFKNIDQVLLDNSKREELQRVPANVVINMFERFEYPNITECHELIIIKNY